jgi:hypothetical protein
MSTLLLRPIPLRREYSPMTVPNIVLDLVERFERNLAAYRSGSYNETQLRRASTMVPDIEFYRYEVRFSLKKG